ncbi:TetR/AcrR family transcriptional regulator [Agromyces sp. LHK192]|uniref:TetR/AcrR family transcriptional regulator n=1 Tax=Agromyces sp. LHK192 TaxID=2498704 RepID=UPI0013E3F6D7|nr:TetR/AcrR family transcriptional regulator [Agromyces sp. LHK192]
MTRSRALITAAATRRFLEDGYPATSVDDVAAEAGVSKRTVYNVFDDKEQLFRAIILQAIDTAERFSTTLAASIATAADVDVALRELARLLAESVLGGLVVPLRRLLIAEAVRFPDLAAEYRERAPERVMAGIAEALEAFRQRGALEFDDAALAAEHFAFLAIGASLDRALFVAAPATGPGGGPVEVAAAVDRAELGAAAFLQAYAAR